MSSYIQWIVVVFGRSLAWHMVARFLCQTLISYGLFLWQHFQGVLECPFMLDCSGLDLIQYMLVIFVSRLVFCSSRWIFESSENHLACPGQNMEELSWPKYFNTCASLGGYSDYFSNCCWNCSSASCALVADLGQRMAKEGVSMQIAKIFSLLWAMGHGCW